MAHLSIKWWHQMVREQCGPSGLRSAISPGFAAWLGPGWGCRWGMMVGVSRGHPPQLKSVGCGVVWVTGLFCLCMPIPPTLQNPMHTPIRYHHYTPTASLEAAPVPRISVYVGILMPYTHTHTHTHTHPFHLVHTRLFSPIMWSIGKSKVLSSD